MSIFGERAMLEIAKLTIILMFCSLVVAASFSAPTQLSSLKERSGVPFGYYDTEASGARRAKQDLAGGKVKYAVYGLPPKPFVDKLVSAGVTPLFMGCLVGGEGTSFWTGYNDYVESHLPSRFPTLHLD